MSGAFWSGQDSYVVVVSIEEEACVVRVDLPVNGRSS